MIFYTLAQSDSVNPDRSCVSRYRLAGALVYTRPAWCSQIVVCACRSYVLLIENLLRKRPFSGIGRLSAGVSASLIVGAGCSDSPGFIHRFILSIALFVFHRCFYLELFELFLFLLLPFSIYLLAAQSLFDPSVFQFLLDALQSFAFFLFCNKALFF